MISSEAYWLDNSSYYSMDDDINYNRDRDELMLSDIEHESKQEEKLLDERK